MVPSLDWDSLQYTKDVLEVVYMFAAYVLSKLSVPLVVDETNLSSYFQSISTAGRGSSWSKNRQRISKRAHTRKNHIFGGRYSTEGAWSGYCL